MTGEVLRLNSPESAFRAEQGVRFSPDCEGALEIVFRVVSRVGLIVVIVFRES